MYFNFVCIALLKRLWFVVVWKPHLNMMKISWMQILYFSLFSLKQWSLVSITKLKRLSFEKIDRILEASSLCITLIDLCSLETMCERSTVQLCFYSKTQTTYFLYFVLKEKMKSWFDEAQKWKRTLSLWNSLQTNCSPILLYKQNSNHWLLQTMCNHDTFKRTNESVNEVWSKFFCIIIS